MIEKKVREVIEKKVNDMGIDIDSIVYENVSGNNFLRIVIDRKVPIDVDTCVEVTHVIDPLLDTIDLLNDSYILDISSKEKGEDYE